MREAFPGLPLEKEIPDYGVRSMLQKTIDKMTREEKAQFFRFDSIFRLNGLDPETGSFVKMSDALSIQNAAFMIPRVLTQMVQEGVEPFLIGTSLLQQIPYQPGMMAFYPAMDVLVAREVGDGQALPTFQINVAGGTMLGLSVQRHGLALRVNQRFIEQSSYPWISYWMRLAGYALARHKEERIFNFIGSIGTVAFDNSVAARQPSSQRQPVFGHTKGRNIKGQFNGSMTLDDIFDMYSLTMMQGFIADTLLVHPMTYLMWVKDPVMREFAIQAGGGSFFGSWTGNAAARGYQGLYNFQGLGQGLGQTGQFTQGALTGGTVSTPQGLPQNQTSAPVIPNYLGIPFRIVVSPFVRYSPQTKTTDIKMFDSRNLGALIVGKQPTVLEWDEKLYNMHNIGIEEEYGFAMLNEGQAVSVAKNVRVTANEFVTQARTVVSVNDASFEMPNSQFGSNPLDVNSR